MPIQRPIFDPHQPVQDLHIIEKKIARGLPLTETEAQAVLVQEMLRWGEGEITLRELFRRLTLVGDLLDLDLP